MMEAKIEKNLVKEYNDFYRINGFNQPLDFNDLEEKHDRVRRLLRDIPGYHENEFSDLALYNRLKELYIFFFNWVPACKPENRAAVWEVVRQRIMQELSSLIEFHEEAETDKYVLGMILTQYLEIYFIDDLGMEGEMKTAVINW